MTIETNTNPFQNNQIHSNGKVNRLKTAASFQMRTHGVMLVRWKVIRTIFHNLNIATFWQSYPNQMLQWHNRSLSNDNYELAIPIIVSHDKFTNTSGYNE